MRVTAIMTPPRQITLPWPPSVNTYWRMFNNRILISKAGRAYRTAAILACRGVTPLDGKVAVRIRAYPPDNRRRDLDNVLKAALDGLVHGQVIADDSDIDDLRIVRQGNRPGGELELELEAMEDDN